MPAPRHNLQRFEPLEPDELEFLQTRYRTGARQFYSLMKYLLVAVVLIPLFFLLLHDLFVLVDEFTSTQVWFFGQLTTLTLFFVAFIAGYVKVIHPFESDLKKKVKVVETTLVHEKKFMPHNATYHFYVHAEPIYTIEVDADTYHRFEVSDEINIEYTPRTEIFLGYF